MPPEGLGDIQLGMEGAFCGVRDGKRVLGLERQAQAVLALLKRAHSRSREKSIEVAIHGSVPVGCEAGLQLALLDTGFETITRKRYETSARLALGPAEFTFQTTGVADRTITIVARGEGGHCRAVLPPGSYDLAGQRDWLAGELSWFTGDPIRVRGERGGQCAEELESVLSSARALAAKHRTTA